MTQKTRGTRREHAAGIRFEIPGRCVPCPRPRAVRGGRAYYPRRYTDWLEGAQVEALKAGRVLWEGPVAVSATFSGARSNADIDNLLKSVLDAIQGIIIVDDKQVVSVVGDKREYGSEAFTAITVEPA